MRIKDYADSKGVTSQTIYKKMRSPKYKERLKGHLYRDNQKVENLDLIGIKILEDYAFENDVIKLEHELNKLKEMNKQEKQDMQIRIDKLADKLTSSLENRNNLIQERYDLLDYIRSLERQRKILLIVITTIVLSFLIVIGFTLF
ncbi:hypothetical protein [Streptococcus equi]|uniref:hypothetical protein n=1 Tax=Streptococcus equi TaxID=1336 RepID=UPI0005BC39CE|nr:hypothetical protein [Streptococcus equi]KIS05702.1 hypothetical protein AT53_01418 [Streptococcus equi subsp. zooepidemicus Sz5]